MLLLRDIARVYPRRESMRADLSTRTIEPPCNKIQKIMYRAQVDSRILEHHCPPVAFEDRKEPSAMVRVDLDRKYDWHLF